MIHTAEPTVILLAATRSQFRAVDDASSEAATQTLMNRVTRRGRLDGHEDRNFTRGRTRRPVLVYTGLVDGSSDDSVRGGGDVTGRGEGDDERGLRLTSPLHDGTDPLGCLFPGTGSFFGRGCSNPCGVEVLRLEADRSVVAVGPVGDRGLGIVVGDRLPVLSD
jgi:hypothetical protein